jgi:hypothetical protein
MSRQAAVLALATAVNNAYAWVTPVNPSARIKLADEVDASVMPICYVFEGGFERYERPHSSIPKRALQVRLIIYTACPDSSTSDAAQQDEILDALDSALDLSGTDQISGRKTLGGTVYNCQINGGVLKVPGDFDGKGMIVVPLTLILP